MSYAAMVQHLIAWAAPWSSAYSDSKVIAVAVLFAHVGGLLVAGGLALAADRDTWRARRVPVEARADHLAALRGVHRPVVVALSLVVASGVLLFLSDVKTYAASVAFAVKLLLVALLLANGLLMLRAEAALGAAEDKPGRQGPTAWRLLQRCARASAVLWLATTLAGVVLGNG